MSTRIHYWSYCFPWEHGYQSIIVVNYTKGTGLYTYWIGLN